MVQFGGRGSIRTTGPIKMYQPGHIRTYVSHHTATLLISKTQYAHPIHLLTEPHEHTLKFALSMYRSVIIAASRETCQHIQHRPCKGNTRHNLTQHGAISSAHTYASTLHTYDVAILCFALWTSIQPQPTPAFHSLQKLGKSWTSKMSQQLLYSGDT